MSDHMPSVPVCPHCGTAVPEWATKTERLEAECNRLHKTAAHLKGELTKIQGGGSDAKDIEELHDEWLAPRAARGGRKPALSDDRKAAYRKLLKAVGKEDALKAIRQSAKMPYLVFGRYSAASKDPSRDRRDDITVIVAKADRYEQLIQAYDGDSGIPTPQAEPQGAPRAHRLHMGWTPLYRATAALTREAGLDTVQPEYGEVTLFDGDHWHPPILRYHAWCPLHPNFVGLRLWGDAADRVHAECDGACDETEIVRAIFALEDKQVRRVEALLAFERMANPETLDKVVKALEIRADDSRYRIARKMGIHDDQSLGLLESAA